MSPLTRLSMMEGVGTRGLRPWLLAFRPYGAEGGRANCWPFGPNEDAFRRDAQAAGLGWAIGCPFGARTGGPERPMRGLTRYRAATRVAAMLTLAVECATVSGIGGVSSLLNRRVVRCNEDGD